MTSSPINLREKLSRFDEHWTPRIVAELNGQYVKLAKGLGDLVWHAHADEDELFLVIEGRLTLELREVDADGRTHERAVDLDPGEMFVVPRGVEHRPIAREEVHILLFEPTSTAHTGDVRSDQTVETLDWI